jgi:hypothetical protein
MDRAILQPVVVLIGWTLIIFTWAVATRLPAMKAAGIDLRTLVGSKGSDADRVLPPAVQWKAHNYNHLLEQPTLFYAVCFLLAVAGPVHPFNVALAWSYVAFRIAHSLVQTTSNRVSIRFLFFVLGTVALTALTLHAALEVF